MTNLMLYTKTGHDGGEGFSYANVGIIEDAVDKKGSMTQIRIRNHNDLQGRDAADCHHMTSVTGLNDAIVNEASYIIYKSGSTINAKNGTTGNIDFSGTDSSTVIQSALNKLTQGRTWKEKVTIKGTHNISSAISVPSYTILDINGTLIEGEGLFNIINVFGVTLVEIRNGILDGNKNNIANQGTPSAQRGIRIDNSSTYVIVENVELKNLWWGALSIQGNSSNVMVSKCYAHDCANTVAAFFVNPGSYVSFVQCFANVPNVGFWCYSNSSFVKFIGCTAINCDNGYSTGPEGGGVENIEYIGCESYNSNVGFDLLSGKRLRLVGCKSHTSLLEGIYIHGTVEPIVIGCHIENSNTGGSSGHAGILLGGTPTPGTGCTDGIVSNNIVKNTNNSPGIAMYNAQKIVITGNRCFDDQALKTQTYGMQLNQGGGGSTDYCEISNNILTDNLIGGVIISAAGSHQTQNIKNNIGYMTENSIISGTFAIDSTGVKTVTIAHGLDITPNIQDCYLTIIQNTAVDDWAYNMLKIVSVDATNAIAKINVSTQSATAGATAKLGLRIGNQ